MPAPIMGDHPVTTLHEEQHLGVPVVSRQRPAVAEDDRLSGPPVLVEDLRAVGRGHHAHGLPPSICACCRYLVMGRLTIFPAGSPGRPVATPVNSRELGSAPGSQFP